MVHETLDALSETERHRVLGDELRRYLIELFAAENRPIEASLGELASDIDRANPDELTAEVKKDELLIRLHHIHLPMLAEVGVVEYDRETRQIQVAESGSSARLTNSQ